MDDWLMELRRGNSDAAWDLFIARYHRLIFAAIYHYTRDPGDVTDAFTRACEALRTDDQRRLRTHVVEPTHRASFSTWLVAVIHNLTIDYELVRAAAPTLTFGQFLIELREIRDSRQHRKPVRVASRACVVNETARTARLAHSYGQLQG